MLKTKKEIKQMKDDELKLAIRIAEEKIKCHEILSHEYYLNRKTMVLEQKKRGEIQT